MREAGARKWQTACHAPGYRECWGVLIRVFSPWQNTERRVVEETA